jgi:hypothetical protein
VATFVPTYVGTVATKAGLSAPYYSAVAGLLGTGIAIFGFISLGFCADWIGRRPTAMIWYAACLILTPVVYMWAQSMGALLGAVTVFGFFTGGIWAWAPIWLPELFPTRMRGTAVAFCFNAPRWISCIGPLIAGTLIVALAALARLQQSSVYSSSSALWPRRFCPRPTADHSRTPCNRRPSPTDRQHTLPHFEALQAFQKTQPEQRLFEILVLNRSDNVVDRELLYADLAHHDRRYTNLAIGSDRAAVKRERLRIDAHGASIFGGEHNQICASIDEKPDRCAIDRSGKAELAMRVGMIDEGVW